MACGNRINHLLGAPGFLLQKNENEWQLFSTITANEETIIVIRVL